MIKDKFLTRYLDLITVKGKKEPIKIYELMSSSPQQPDWINNFNQGIKLYEERKWQLASEQFKEVLKSQPEDGPSQMYIKRCHEYMQQAPPDNWDGVYRFKTK